MKNSTVLKLQAPWEKVKERMKENDINLTDKDLEYIPGKEEELIQRLEKIMNRSRDQVVAYIESISSNEDLAG
jgi:5-bromo-4-chloroindolyl phosphate hydrolysis protein